MISQETLLELANKHEPAASQSLPSYRAATCVVCGKTMHKMWHCWLNIGGFKKEIHLCRKCGIKYHIEG